MWIRVIFDEKIGVKNALKAGLNAPKTHLFVHDLYRRWVRMAWARRRYSSFMSICGC